MKLLIWSHLKKVICLSLFYHYWMKDVLILTTRRRDRRSLQIPLIKLKNILGHYHTQTMANVHVPNTISFGIGNGDTYTLNIGPGVQCTNTDLSDFIISFFVLSYLYRRSFILVV